MELDRYTKGFVLASSVYFSLAAGLGAWMGMAESSEMVFKKYYGAACFSCPGQATESIRQSAMMHNVDEKKVLAELNEAAGLLK